jgi:hypothetical protein
MYKNPKNGQKWIGKFVSSLGVDFQDGLVFDYTLSMIFWVSNNVSE